MYLTVRQRWKRYSHDDLLAMQAMSHTFKNLINEGIYNVRQHYFNTGKYLHYEENYELIKKYSKNYPLINSNVAQQALKKVDEMFSSFFALLKQNKASGSNTKVHIPGYLPKDGFATIVIAQCNLEKGYFKVPFSRTFGNTHTQIKLPVPPILQNKTVKQIKIVPKANARRFEMQYAYEVEPALKQEPKATALAIDFGVDNLMTAVSNTGESFIIDGRKLKSINQQFNKRESELQRAKAQHKQAAAYTKQQWFVLDKRERQVNDILSKAAAYTVNYCVAQGVSTLVVGYNSDFQFAPNLGKRTNQTFTCIPFGKLKAKLEYLCKLNGLTFVEQEESYTSKASFWDRDVIPTYVKGKQTSYKFSGKRVSRGLYKTSSGKLLNADVNGALNILRKSNVADLTVVYGRGEVDTPVRVKVV